MDILLVFSGFIFSFLVVLLYEYRISLLRRQRNNVHFYVARDKSGELYLYFGKPIRGNDKFMIISTSNTRFLGNKIEDYGLNSSNYDNLKWEDEPVEVFLNLRIKL